MTVRRQQLHVAYAYCRGGHELKVWLLMQSTNAEHVNRPAHKAKTATTTGRKLQATAPAPAPEQGPGARRTDMPPLPPIGPGMPMQAQAPQPGAMPAEGVCSMHSTH